MEKLCGSVSRRISSFRFSQFMCCAHFIIVSEICQCGQHIPLRHLKCRSETNLLIHRIIIDLNRLQLLVLAEISWTTWEKNDSPTDISAQDVARSLGIYGHDNNNGILLESKCHENAVSAIEYLLAARGSAQIDVRILLCASSLKGRDDTYINYFYF